jgi:YVTN family beta-propeller protein
LQESTVMRFLVALFVLLSSFLTTAWAQNAPFPPSPRQLVAVNPITNKVYIANEAANTVTVLNNATNTTTTIPVGNRPQFIVVNPLTNKIYVNNGGEASLTVIDGETDTNLTPTPYPVGSQGPMAINAESNVVYIVRMTSVATDEVSFFNGNNNTWYTIATESFQPTAVAANPVTDTIYVAHYGTGDVRVISGAFDNTVLHPTTFSIPAWSKPFAIAANTNTNKIYVITEDSRGPIGVIDGATRTVQWPTPAAGHAVGPKALAVNPVTNKIYAAFANEVVVIDGNTNGYTYIPVTTGSTASIAINYYTNKIYVSSDGGTLTVIDGGTNATSTLTVPAGTISLGVNPVTNEVFAAGGGTTIVDGVGTATVGVTPVTTINALPSNQSAATGSITMTTTNPAPNPLPIRGIFFQVDSTEGAWTAASGSGNGPYTASFSGLAPGSHTIYAFATEGHIAPTDTGQQSNPLFGSLASYAFTVTATSGATVSLLSSANPSTVGQAVTFTASVTGSGATPTGTVTFKDGATTLCSAVALASGTATCTTSALAAGSHTISANYSGDSSYGAAAGSIPQTVNKVAASVGVGTTPNPSMPGQSVTITATVSGANGTATGTVTFKDGATTLCSAVALASGAASCTTSSLSSGSHSLTAAYSGNATYNTASGTATQEVGVASSSVALTSSLNPSRVSQSVTFTATVSATGATPTGTVTFLDGTTALCSAVALSSGTASCSTPSLAAGSHTITASYSGNSSYGASSKTLTQTVNKQSLSAMTLGATPNPATTGQSVILAATVTGQSGVPAPTGSVTFTAGVTTLCNAVPLSGSSAQCTASFSAAGSFTITATYSGDARYTTASQTTTVAVNAPDTGPAAKSEITSPTPGSTLTASTVTFTWSAGSQVTERYLMVGTAAGAGDIYAAYQGGATSRTVSGLPTDGRTVYVRLQSWVSGGWQVSNYTYKAMGGSTGGGGETPPTSPTPSSMTSPAPGSTLAGASVTFTWSAGNGVAERYLSIGSTANGGDLYSAYQGAATSRNVSALPTDGRTIFVQLSSYINGAWQTRSYTYTAASGTGGGGGDTGGGGTGGGDPPPTSPTPSAITSPANGSTLPGASVTFAWNGGNGVTERYLSIGTTPGRGDLYTAYQGSATSRTVTLPADGRAIYVQLSSWMNGAWQTKSYSYTAASAGGGGDTGGGDTGGGDTGGGGTGGGGTAPSSSIYMPVNGSTLSSTTVQFNWTAGTGVKERYLTVGTTATGSDIYAGYQGAATSRTVSGLPANGQAVYVQLWSWINGAWQIERYSYTATR